MHVSEFVNGAHARPLADNDLRGYLDGRVPSPWNQAGQSYTRMGRLRYRRRPPPNGEDEVFRTLHRWTGIDLPRGSRVMGARLALTTHSPVPKDCSVYVYAVRRDWGPGRGGVRKDNVSVPEVGEVWWGEAKHGEESWTLPGASHSANDDPEADTDVHPLAVSHCRAGEIHIELSGHRMAAYVERQITDGLPLLFLLKLSDWAEDDEGGSLIKLRSAEFGSDESSEGRPRLILDWTPPPGAECTQVEVFLEHGRVGLLEPMSLPEGDRIWLTFATDEGFESPRIEIPEDGPAGEPDQEAWRPLGGYFESVGGPLAIRARAVRNPVVLGNEFSARFTDTWVVTAPAEDQRLEWRFVSPSGASHRIAASYEGGFSWKVGFVPDELGRWTAQWRHRFSGPEEVGPEDVFDVVAPSVEVVCRLLHELGDRIEAGDRSTAELEQALGRLYRLERAGMQGLGSAGFHSPRGAEFRAAVDRSREVLGRTTLPPRDQMTSMAQREKVGKRTFSEAIPWSGYFRSEDYEPPPPWTAVVARFLRRWHRRLRRRVSRLILGR